jgi:hypothetical protein
VNLIGRGQDGLETASVISTSARSALISPLRHQRLALTAKDMHWSTAAMGLLPPAAPARLDYLGPSVVAEYALDVFGQLAFQSTAMLGSCVC